MLTVLRTISLFILAALCETGGAFLIWQWQRADKTALGALLGAVLLFIYGFIQTAQSFNFGRAFAAYGGIFILTVMLWGWFVDGRVPDRFDWLGVGICLLGVTVILWSPRPA